MREIQTSTAVGRPSPSRAARIAALAVVCGVVLPSVGDGGVGVALAFSPPCHLRAANPTSIAHVRSDWVATSSARTRLSYKHLDEEDDDSMRMDHEGRNETALDGKAKKLNVDVSVDVNVEINKGVIYYNDLEPVAESSDSYNVSFAGSADGLIHELEDVIQQKNVDPSPKAIEPSESKPAKKFVSPIQMMKKVPRVTPVHMSTVFFLKLIGDPQWPAAQSPPTKKEVEDNKTETKLEATKPAVENWKMRMEKQGKRKSTAFMATSYLEALSAGADTENGSDDKNEDDMLKDLRDQQAQMRKEQLQAQQQAMWEATRRTNPREAIEKRIEEGERMRKEKEREKLERLYVERKERLDAKKRNEQRYLEERARQKKLLEQRARERSEADTDGESSLADAEELSSTNSVKRGIPILDRPSFLDAPPLLVGSTLIYRYSDLTLFQRRAVEVAQSHHAIHLKRMKAEKEEESSEGLDHLVEMLDDGTVFRQSRAGEEGGIQAAPILAVVDGYTADDVELSADTTQGAGLPKKRRYATLASVEVVYDSNTDEPSMVKLMGVGRVFLRDYFSSREVGLTEEEEELSKLLARIQEMNGSDSLDEEDHTEEHDDEDEELPALMAEFDLLLDDASILSEETSTKYGQDVTKSRSSSMHAITELYRSANKVYRLHEERKRIVAGLRAGVARLRLGKDKAANGECNIEFEDCDGLGLIGGAIDGVANDVKSEVMPELPANDDAPRSRLETLENYGLGNYGVLSTIPDLTTQLMSRLEPYYSPAHREREEHEAGVASMVVFRTLEGYATSSEVATALMIPSATQRLEMAYAIMMRHRDELNGLAEIISEELVECGEECADLW